MAKEAGKKTLSGLKVQKEFKSAIDAAQEEGLLHLEAFAYERAGMYFEQTGNGKLCSEYLMKAHSCYDRWNAVAKVIDLETRFARRLKVGQPRRDGLETAKSYKAQNEKLRYDPTQKIGGGQGEIKPLNIKKAMKRTTKKVKRFLTPRGMKDFKDDLSEEEMLELQIDLDDDEFDHTFDDVEDDGAIDDDDARSGKKSLASKDKKKTKKKPAGLPMIGKKKGK
jgi:hypothetical protein